MSNRWLNFRSFSPEITRVVGGVRADSFRRGRVKRSADIGFRDPAKTSTKRRALWRHEDYYDTAAFSMTNIPQQQNRNELSTPFGFKEGSFFNRFSLRILKSCSLATVDNFPRFDLIPNKIFPCNCMTSKLNKGLQLQKIRISRTKSTQRLHIWTPAPYFSVFNLFRFFHPLQLFPDCPPFFLFLQLLLSFLHSGELGSLERDIS